ncbi:MAG: nitrous oxide reductase accessory protein NosL, partial [Marinobacter sp.]
PKGEVITEKEQTVHKFCSTRDMFAWVLQPENVMRKHTLYVHDMSQTEWASPDDTALIDAREAFYVVGSERKGAMGQTLASFSTEAAAQDFMMEYGGEVLQHDGITLEHLNTAMPKGDMH